MDNLTHTLLGITLSRAGLNRLTPQAGWLMLAAVNTPDLDIVTGLKSNAWYLECHRGWTHTLVFAPLIALFPVGIWWLLTRRLRPRASQWAGAYAAALIGVLSHLLLDWVNVYGIRLLWPFSDRWWRLDLLYIIDVWLWAILIISTAVPFIGRLVSSEIGAKPSRGTGAAWFTLICMAGYLAFRVHLHGLAYDSLDARMHLDRRAQQVAAFPTPLNPWLWSGLAELPDAYRMYEMNLLRDFDPDQGRTIYKIPSTPAIEAAKKSESAQAFLSFAQFPYWRTSPDQEVEGGEIVTLSDLRFGLPEDGRFIVTVRLDARLNIVSESFEFGSLQPR